MRKSKTISKTPLLPVLKIKRFVRLEQLVARQAHALEVVGSNPSPGIVKILSKLCRIMLSYSIPPEKSYMINYPNLLLNPFVNT